MDRKIFDKYITEFLAQNSKLNLISKNDEKFLWEKHIYDSLSLSKFFEKLNIAPKGKSLIDIGTGGGFPSIPLAIAYPEMSVTALDSIRKKINAISEIKERLELTNLNPVCERAENLKGEKYDFVTSRAVAAMKILIPYAIPLMKPDGYFIAYKSLRAEEELKEAESIIEKYNIKIKDIIEYDLPLAENHTRNLIIISKK